MRFASHGISTDCNPSVCEHACMCGRALARSMVAFAAEEKARMYHRRVCPNDEQHASIAVGMLHTEIKVQSDKS